jgi:hypothetical protein
MKNKTLTSAKFKFSVFCLLFLLFSLSCSDDDQPIEKPIEDDNVIVMVNPSDPLLMVVNNADGYRLEYYGDRDDQGLTEVITHLKVMDSKDTIKYFFTEAGQLIKMIDASGVEIDLDWNSSDELVLSALSKDGSLQINTQIPLEDSGGRLRPNESKRGNTRAGKHIRLKKGQPIAKQNKTTQAEADGNVNINVSRCGESSAATIFVKVREEYTGEYVGDFPAKAVAEGKYLTSIPTSKLPISDNGKYCEALVKAIRVICEANKLLKAGNAKMACAYLGAITSGIATPMAGTILTAACLGFNVAANYLCFVPVKENVCTAKFLDRHYEDVVLIAYAVGIPANIYSTPYKINGGNIPNNQLEMNLDLGSNTLVRSLTLNPAAPLPNQDYTAEANLYCVKAGATVRLSVSGTDGFTDEVTTTTSLTEKEASYYLEVPGAEQGVQDIVTLEVQGSGDENIVRSASLVFN